MSDQEAWAAEEDTVPVVRIAEIHAVLDGNGDLAALDALGLVLQWAAEVLRTDAVNTPAAAFRAVAMTDRALASAPAFFAALTAVVERGEPATEVVADLERYAERLAELERRTAPQRERLAALVQAEERMRAEIARQDKDSARIAELEGVERLAAAAAELRAQRDALEARAQTVAAIVTTADAELSAAADRLITLTAELLDSLAHDTRAVLVRAGEQQQLLEARLADHRGTTERVTAETGRLHTELAEAEAEAAQARARYEGLRAEAAGRLAALRRHAAEDHKVAEALAGRPASAGKGEDRLSALVAGAVRTLGEIDARLAEVDHVLGNVLNEDDQGRAGTALRREMPGAVAASPGEG